MKIRLAEAADTDAVLAVARRFHEESRFAAYPFNAGKTRESIAQTIANPSSTCILLAEPRAGCIAGFLAAFVAAPRFTDVLVAQDHGFYVLPEFRGGSAAMKLMIAFRRWAENRKVAEICVNQNVDIDQARFNRFMRHLGFACCGSNFVMPLGSGTKPGSGA
jgi:GNAT superfamily N-acetyltransferase